MENLGKHLELGPAPTGGKALTVCSAYYQKKEVLLIDHREGIGSGSVPRNHGTGPCSPGGTVSGRRFSRECSLSLLPFPFNGDVSLFGEYPYYCECHTFKKGNVPIKREYPRKTRSLRIRPIL